MWHARLVMIKNTAYAWRQMVFFLALLPESGVFDFIRWAEDHLNGQKEAFQKRFRPALNGLVLAAKGVTADSNAAKNSNAIRFLGWSKTKHWLATDDQDK